ncbi:unnamed protein product [Cuscuta epithymum]|uniref:6-phosphogluconate dehydrogenase NADP-binding domain-containing protein n=1 Tax=Cuscuta epithymum TaxID=186058 RepID=A0AAV0GCT5_9ASTE|nr:unnamed protein product [Cuscuta epithymum]
MIAYKTAETRVDVKKRTSLVTISSFSFLFFLGLLIGMLSAPCAALSVVFDKNSVLEQICSGKNCMDMSTVDADTSSKMNEDFFNHILKVDISHQLSMISFTRN